MSESQQTDEIRQLVEQLREPRTRRSARQKLIAARAVDALLECLQSTNESVVWAAVESLGELRATEAVGPLVELLDRGVLVTNVCEALTLITGKDFAADVRRWRDWARKHPTMRPAATDVEDRVRHTGELLGASAAGSGKSFHFQLPLPTGRSQKVAVYFGREDTEGEELIVIYSECGPANPKHFETVLRKNLSIPSGAFAVRDVDAQPTLVIVDTVIAASGTPSVLAKKIEHIADLADRVEKSLTKEDQR